MPRSIAVVGSLNIDYVIRTPRVPTAGETLTARSLSTGYGGKGANQAVACARLSTQSTKVYMVGNVGNDSNGTNYIAKLEQEHIDASAIKKITGQQTGTASIIVEDNGENRIMFVPGANHDFNDSDLNLVPSSAEIAVFQLEIPSQVVMGNIRRSRVLNKHVIFNPSPAIELPEAMLADVDTLILNETEANTLPFMQGIRQDDIDSRLSRLLAAGVRQTVIMTYGSKGVHFGSRRQGTGMIKAHEVQVVDTTAAGDTFLGAYAAYLAEHGDECIIQKAIEFANSAAALAVQTAGAMSSIPTRDMVLQPKTAS